MSKHNVVVPPADDIDDQEAPYAEAIVIDEGGIDLLVDGENVISAAFEGLDNFQLAYEVLPESFLLPKGISESAHERFIEEIASGTVFTDLDLEQTARVFLTALARRKGYEKK